MFEALSAPPEDALHGVMTRFATDERSDKIDLGVGIFRNETGLSPVMRAIAVAEELRLKHQKSKSYLPLRGDERFLRAMSVLAFNQSHERVAAVQSVGGTGGVRLAIELATIANPDLGVIIGTPTWPNHLTICEQLGIKPTLFQYFDTANQTVLFDNLCDAVKAARSGDVLVLHGPCHNPTGEDLTEEQFDDILELADKQGVIPLIDVAYYGLGNGLEEDLSSIRKCLLRFSTAFIVLSCSKAFGLYRERTGVLFVATPNQTQASIVQGTLERIGRTTYSMPPAHGAAAVACVLEDTNLRCSWLEELTAMRMRIRTVRKELAEEGGDLSVLSAVSRQSGIFSLLPIDSTVVSQLAVEHAIYMPQSGRINVVGLKKGDAGRFAEALRQVLGAKS